jgi:hypothetical protein
VHRALSEDETLELISGFSMPRTTANGVFHRVIAPRARVQFST